MGDAPDITLRALTSDDAPALAALCAQPEVARWTGHLPFSTAHELRTSLEQYDPEQSLKLGGFAANGELLGVAMLDVQRRRRRTHIGRLWMAVRPEAQGRGLGTRLLRELTEHADRWLGLVRLELGVNVANTRAQRLYERAGFVVEARRRAEMMVDGELADGFWMARLRPGWTPAPSLPPRAPGVPPARPATGPITVRAVEPTDAAALSASMSALSGVWGTLQIPYTPASFWSQRLAASEPGQRHLLAAEVGGRWAGNAGLHLLPSPRMRHVAGLGMSVDPEFQGMGVGRRLMESLLDLADRWLGLERLELEVFVDNDRAIQLYQRFGFETEGRLRAAALRDGDLCDNFLMARRRGRAAR